MFCLSGNLRVVDETKAKRLKIKPGQKICNNCNNMLLQKIEDNESTSVASDQEFEPNVMKHQSLDSSFGALGCSPVKLVAVERRTGYGKRKVKDIHSAAKAKVAKVLDVPVSNLSESETEECDRCKEWEILKLLIKEKCATATRREKVKFVTLAPESWSVRRAAEEFGVTRWVATQAKKMREEKGILSEAQVKKGHGLSNELVKRIVDFYQSDEYSRMCPGKKDFVSIKVNVEKIQMQKRLLLVNLRELYLAFKEQTKEQISFSKFCELRPKWCLPVSSSGMHSVCVCESHQNVKLLVNAIPIQGDYKDLLLHMVCSTDDRECMIHLYDSCPGKEGLQAYLNEVFEQNDFDVDDVVSYKQWVHTDRTTLVSVQSPLHEFIDVVCSSFDHLRHHHFIMKAQASFLRSLKDGLAPDTAIILLDFAENYSFIVQDAVQGHHWDNSQATLHPFAVYYQDAQGLQCLSLCIISDCLKHDTTAVHCFLSSLLPHLRHVIHNLQKVIYFSDGAASQYKNYKNFSNLCHHKHDFDIPAEWHFFATSHGKSPCDGIGGTVKRLTARASLQATDANHILTPMQMFQWATENIKNITFFFISAEDIKKHEETFELERRYALAKTITGTRSHHCFIPISKNKIRMKRISQDRIFTDVSTGQQVDSERSETAEYLESEQSQADQLQNSTFFQPGKYIACIYDDDWFIGSIVERSDEHGDVYVKFMKRVNNILTWPSDQRQIPCWVPFQHIICCVSAPGIYGRSARQYKLEQKDHENILSLLPHFLK